MTSSTSDDRRSRLLRWFFDHNGYLHKSLDLTFTEENGQHFCTTADISTPSGKNTAQILCRCPFSLSLSFLNVLSDPPTSTRNCSTSSACRHLVGKVSRAVVSYFFLCEQRLLDEKSFWAAYIDTLPSGEDMSTPWWFGEEDLVWLLGTNVHLSSEVERSGVEMRRGMWKRQWEDGVRVLEGAGTDVRMYTWELFLWAATIFSSRSFTSLIFSTTTSEASGKESFALLYPVLDSFNHKFGAKVLWNMDDGDFELSTTETAKKGEQVYNNYAPKGNEELLNGYGFCIPNNPCDEVALRLGKPPDPVLALLQEQYPHRYPSSDWTDEAAMFFLRGNNHYSGGYEHSGNDTAHVRGIPRELLGTIKAILDYSYKQQGEEMPKDHLELATVDAILERLIAKLHGIEQYDEHLPLQPTNDKQRFAKLYRDGQIGILRQIISEIETYLAEF